MKLSTPTRSQNTLFGLDLTRSRSTDSTMTVRQETPLEALQKKEVATAPSQLRLSSDRGSVFRPMRTAVMTPSMEDMLSIQRCDAFDMDDDDE
jgi:hypothetical protein